MVQYLAMISDLWNCCKTSRSLETSAFSVFIISKGQSSLSTKFYNRNWTLQAEAISDIVRIDWPDWLVLYQFIIVINYICD